MSLLQSISTVEFTSYSYVYVVLVNVRSRRATTVRPLTLVPLVHSLYCSFDLLDRHCIPEMK